MSQCPLCSSRAPEPFLVRDPVPVHQNLVLRDAGAARALRRGRLALHVCQHCGFVFNAAYDPALLSYGAAYDNTQSFSPAFETYLAELAQHLVDERGVRASRIVEIGCGKGSFLRELVQRDAANSGVGFDPSYSGPETDANGRIQFEQRFYDETCAHVPADVVVCRHVIEHLSNPIALLRLVRTTIGSRSAKIFFETPCVEWILANNVIWDFFYEHCSYFTARSLAFAFEHAGFDVDSVRRVFDGQYLWLEARPAAPTVLPRAEAGTMPLLARQFADQEATHAATLRDRIDALRQCGPVALWGAAAKGVTLANLIDPDRTRITCIVDLNPKKQGGYLPGTAHPIIAPHEMPAWNVRTAVVTNPNYLEENARLVRQGGLDVRLVDLMSETEVDAHRY